MRRPIEVIGGRRCYALSVAAALAATPGMAVAAAPVGLEFQVNSYTSFHQRRGAVAMEVNGDFVVVWQSARDGAIFGVFAQRFSSSAARLGAEFQINSYTSQAQAYPVIGTDSDGDFVVAWQSDSQDGSDLGVFARRFSSTGAALATELQVNTYTISNQAKPSIALDANGDFVVVWHSSGQDDGDDAGVFGKRFASTGAPRGVEFQVNTHTIDLQSYADVAMDSDGDFVVAWGSQNQDGPFNSVFARRFSSSGSSGGEFQVNTYTAGSQAYPSVGMDQGGDFVVAWESQLQDGSFDGLFARRFASSTAAVGGEFQVSVYTLFTQDQVSAAMEADGDFIAVWRGAGIMVRTFSSAGVPTSAELQVNAYTPSGGGYPALAANAGGDFVVTWEVYEQDGSGDGVFARRLVASATLDVDGDGSTDPLTDGLLVLRWHFGFTGATLVTGAVDLVDCARCDSTAIAVYLTSIAAQLDIDGDGGNEPLTDGLLVLRWLFGFTGTTLVTGAVDTMNCTRCDAAAIESHLATLE